MKTNFLKNKNFLIFFGISFSILISLNSIIPRELTLNNENNNSQYTRNNEIKPKLSTSINSITFNGSDPSNNWETSPYVSGTGTEENPYSLQDLIIEIDNEEVNNSDDFQRIADALKPGQ